MPLINIRHLHYSTQGKVIFDDLEFLLSAGDRVTIVGENGVGKSTFLQLLNKSVVGYEGVRETTGKIGYLPQALSAVPAISALEYLIKLSERPEWGAVTEYLNNGHWQGLFHSLGGHAVYEDFRQLQLSPQVLTRPMSALSGGEKTKVHLCGLHHREPDILLLDEPTNHLDMAGIEWLEHYVKQFAGGVVMVTHDRMLVNNTAAHISELSPITHRLKHFRGGYTHYLEEQQREYQRAQLLRVTQGKLLKRLGTQLNQAQGAASTSAKRVRQDGDKLGFNARGQRRQKSRSRAVGQLQSQIGLVQSSLPSEPTPRHATAINLGDPLDPQKIWIRGEAISQWVGGSPLLQELSFCLQAGDRLAITGANGVGKTTLLNIIQGLLQPDSGQIWMSDSARLGFLDQEQAGIDLALNAQTLLTQANSQLTTEECLGVLSQFGVYHRPDQQCPLRQLSVGQRRKVQLAAIVASGANILLLDEPTNHMDLPSLEQIENALLDFPGIIIAVSHDRFFLRKLQASLLTIRAPGSKRP